MQENGLITPVYAIGGITLEDIEPLMQTEFTGVAISGLITQATNKKKK
jgi:thiamine-phosphate pyrophosphorylase